MRSHPTSSICASAHSPSPPLPPCTRVKTAVPCAAHPHPARVGSAISPRTLPRLCRALIPPMPPLPPLSPPFPPYDGPIYAPWPPYPLNPPTPIPPPFPPFPPVFGDVRFQARPPFPESPSLRLCDACWRNTKKKTSSQCAVVGTPLSLSLCVLRVVLWSARTEGAAS